MQHKKHSLETFIGKNLFISYGGGPTIVEDLSISIPTGEITVIVGPNGCGKSTLLKALARILTPTSGSVLIDGSDIQSQKTKEIAQQLGLLPQNPSSPDTIVVSDLVRRGRYPHQGIFNQWSSDDEKAVTEALSTTGLSPFADRLVDELSGGQRQRVWIAMILAQNTPIMLLDEPTTHLDIAHQIEVLELLKKLSEQNGRTVIMVLHDLNLAMRYATNLIAMSEGEIREAGRPEDIVTSQMVRDVFSIEAEVIKDPIVGSPLCIPLPPK
mgnify:FL=1